MELALDHIYTDEKEKKENEGKEKDLKYKNFYDLRVTTIGAHPNFIGKINIESLFYYLPMTWLKINPRTDRTKFKNIYPGYAGAILDASYKEERRGLKIHKSFRNAVTLTVSTSSKNIGLKIFSEIAHTFGAQSIYSVEEAMNCFFDEIEKCQKIWDKVHQESEIIERTWLWVLENVRGESYNKYIPYDGQRSNPPCSLSSLSEREEREEKNDFVILGKNKFKLDKNKIKLVQEILNYHTVVPDIFPLTSITPNLPEIDIELANFLINIVPDHYEYSDLLIHYSRLRNSPPIIAKKPELTIIQTSMINHNIDLGFNVRRKALLNEINGLNGFVAYYNNVTTDSVEILYNYEVNEITDKIIRNNKKKNRIVRLNVPETGQVKLSGPCLEVNEYVYNIFMKTILSMKDKIIRKNVSHVLKYIKASSLDLFRQKGEMERKASYNNQLRAYELLLQEKEEKGEKGEKGEKAPLIILNTDEEGIASDSSEVSS